MTKSDIAVHIARRASLSKAVAKVAVNAVFEAGGTLLPGGQGHRVKVRQVCDKESASADGTKPSDRGERCHRRV